MAQKQAPSKHQVKKKKQKKIVRYRKPLNINVGMIIFALIFVYMSFSVYTYTNKEKVRFYEVVEGSIVNNKNYTGVILRQETVERSDSSGYVNYYVREGKRASVGTSIYSIDETGALAEALGDQPDEQMSVNEEELVELKRQLSAFNMSFDDMKFNRVYDMKYMLDAAVMEYVKFSALESVEEALKEKGISFHQIKAKQAGIVSYSIDNYENLTAEEMTMDYFDKSEYTRQIPKSGDLLESGVPIYKVVTSDSWSIVFPVTDEDRQELSDTSAVKIAFGGRTLIASGTFSLFSGADGNTYGKIDLNKYMVQFISDRFVDFEIMSDKVTGLKIPVTSVTTKNFYLVPLDYLAYGGDTSATGFYKETYSDTGTSIVFIPATLYYSTDKDYYIDGGEDGTLKAGDYIVKPQSTERYQIGTTASLQGVYNINKGYSVFKQIEILATNGEYYTIKKGMKYGLSVYDHIVLDASIIGQEGVLIYQ